MTARARKAKRRIKRAAHKQDRRRSGRRPNTPARKHAHTPQDWNIAGIETPEYLT